MCALEYDETATEKLEAIYLGPDIVAQRNDTLRDLGIRPGEHVLDIGSGPGFLASEMAQQTGNAGSVLGVDISESLLERSRQRNTLDWVSYQFGDATDLPCADNAYDVVVSTQVAEYVPDVDAFCAEVYRVLKPGGRGMIVATDWKGVCWHSENPDRMDAVLDAFASHCADSSLPRTLGHRLRRVGLDVSKVNTFPIVNFDRYEGCYSAMLIPLASSYILEQGTLSSKVLEAWSQEQAVLDQNGAHFFSTSRFKFHIRKPR